jgi:hypothetical protein
MLDVHRVMHSYPRVDAPTMGQETVETNSKDGKRPSEFGFELFLRKAESAGSSVPRL